MTRIPSIWRGFSDFPAELDERDEEILGYPICEACGWRGAPLVTLTELQESENWAHTCRLSVADVIRQIQAIRIPQEHELTIEPTFAEWLASR